MYGIEKDSQRRTSRVLIVSNFYPPYVVGGAEIVASNLASWLVDTGVDVTVVSTCGEKESPTCEMVGGVVVRRYFPSNRWWNFERFSPKDIRSCREKVLWNLQDMWNRNSARQFDDLLEEVRPDIVHTHNLKGFSPSIWQTIARRGIPLVHTLHDYYLVCRRGTMLHKNGDACIRRCAGCSVAAIPFRTLAPQPDVLCSPSQWVLDRHLASGVMGKRKSLVVRNGVIGRSKLPQPSFKEISRRPLRLLFIGQLRSEKGVHLLRPVMAVLGSCVRLSVAGEGPLSGSIAEWAAQDSRVTWHGFVHGAQKEELLADADVLLFPSMWSENAPVVIAEAMMQGLPVIASDLGAIPEFVSDEENGLLFPSGDISAMIGAIRRLLEDEELLERLSERAARSAEAWTVEGMGRRYLEIYEDLRFGMIHKMSEALV